MLEEPPLIVRTQDSIIPTAIPRFVDFRKAVSRILSSPKIFGGENHLSQQPVPGTRTKVGQAHRLKLASRRSACPTLAMERAAPWSPIWPCTRWGFPCLRAYAWSGGLF